jgi:hypothetical protein
MLRVTQGWLRMIPGLMRGISGTMPMSTAMLLVYPGVIVLSVNRQ